MEQLKNKIRELVPNTKEPFGLSDVLLAIKKGYKPKYDSYGVAVFPTGMIEIMDWGGGYEPATTVEECQWNLAIPTLDGQTDEVKAFISKLLNV